MLNDQCSPPSQQRSSAPVLHYIFPLVTSPAIVRYIQVGVIVDHLSVMCQCCQTNFKILYRTAVLRAAQYLDPLSAQLVHSSLTHLMAGLGMFDGDVGFILI